MKIKSLISKILIGTVSLGLFIGSMPNIPAYADSFKVVTLGADLNHSQKCEMLKYFDTTSNEANILEVTSKEEYEYLGSIASSSQLGNKAISCSYVEPTTKGGLNITTNNLTWVTEGMIRNALITAGIENTIVKASAPFKVSGTAALTGILKGFENSSAGEKIDEAKKEAANEELFITGEIGEKIGQDDATNLINDVKKEVIKKKPDTEKEMNKIVDKATKEYSSSLSDEDKENIKTVMTKINDLDLNYNNIKDQLNDVTDRLKDKLNSDDAKGFFVKIGDFFSNIWTSLKNFFIGNSSNNNTDDTLNESNNNNNNNKVDESSSSDSNDASNDSIYNDANNTDSDTTEAKENIDPLSNNENSSEEDNIVK